ncbi:glycosyltransferase [Geobacter sulfurreducens]|uniref:glycosyltransferase n=1 Tax=Geobacter sulfurreducens TaxID=35554 RepID=UPI001BDD448E|nr:glycosyltransferase [Geobacter sulfurreducens]QVW33902.1 glycosyltransferase [Geobacter sulfurreducens]
MKKIMLVTYFYPPIGGAGLPGVQRSIKLVKYLNNSRITVLTVNEADYPDYAVLNFNRKLPIDGETIIRTTFKNVFDYVLLIRKVLKSLMINGRDQKQVVPARITNIAAPPLKKPKANFWQKVKDYVYELCNFPDYASGWIIPAVATGRRIIQKQKFDVILATGMPWTALVIAWILHRLSGAKLVVDFRDPWVGNPFDTSKGWFLDRIKSFLERRIVTDAALVTANTTVLRDEFIARYAGKVDTRKFMVLPNGFDPDDFSNLATAEPQQSTEPSPHLILAHAGYLYGKRDPAPILEAIRHLDRTGMASAESFRFVQMGNIHLEYDFHERYRDLEERGVVVDLGTFAFEECLGKLKSSDVLLLIQPGTKSQVPSKLYDYLCLNRPILTMTPLDGALGDLIRENEFGDIFSPDDVAGIASRLNELLREKQEKGGLWADYPNRVRFDIRNIVAGLEQRMDEILVRPETA